MARPQLLANILRLLVVLPCWLLPEAALAIAAVPTRAEVTATPVGDCALS